MAEFYYDRAPAGYLLEKLLLIIKLPFQLLLITTTFCQDLVQITVLTSYSVQCYLLKRYLFILKKKLYQNTIDALDWMRVSFLFKRNLIDLILDDKVIMFATNSNAFQ